MKQSKRVTRVHPAHDDGVVTHKRYLPGDSAGRKKMPLASGLMDYFPDACAAVSEISYFGNEKHNPGEPMHHARGKSMDHADCIARHLVDRGVIDPDTGLSHTVEVAWRALALLQEECEAKGAPMARGAWADAPKYERISGPFCKDPTATAWKCPKCDQIIGGAADITGGYCVKCDRMMVRVK